MSIDLKCDRCGTVKPVAQPTDALASFAQALRNQQTPATWATVMVSKNNVSARTYHLCSDCRGWLEDFMKGDETPAVPLPSTIVLQHQPAADCHLIWDPAVNAGKGGYICSHDEPDRFHFLAGQAASQQGVAKAVAQSDWDEALGRVKPASGVTQDEYRLIAEDKAGDVVARMNRAVASVPAKYRPGRDDEMPDEEPECLGCNHAPHAKHGCGGIVKTKKSSSGTKMCPCTIDWAGVDPNVEIPAQREPEKS